MILKRWDLGVTAYNSGTKHLVKAKRKYKKVKLESVQFNKKFKTYATSEHNAFYVLTPHFMEALMAFEQKNKGKIYFS